MRNEVTAALLAALGAAPALASDSTAALATGGLVVVKTHDIEMRAEDLLIRRTSWASGRSGIPTSERRRRARSRRHAS